MKGDTVKLIHGIKNALKRGAVHPQKELSQGKPSQIIPSASEVEPPDPPDRESLIALVNSFPYWYQRIYLGRGVYTLPTLQLHNYVWQVVETLLPDGFRNASVLDVGTNAGYFCIQAKLKGAGQVIGVDFDDRYLKQAEACRAIWKLDIDYRQADIDRLQLHTLGQHFDVVFFTGILYHLKNPLGVLEQVASLCNDAIVVETEVISPKHKNVLYVRQGPLGRTVVTPCFTGFMKFIEKDELNGDGSNWWVPDEACVLGMLRTAGFKYFSKPRYLGETRMFVVATQQPHSHFRLE
jgi:tRNA (mo5U34)-methyltransferase